MAKFKPDQVVICVESFAMQASPAEGDILAIPRGMRLRADHVAVRAHLDYFLPDGSSEEDFAAQRIRIEQAREVKQVQPARVAPPAPKMIPYEQRAIAVRQAGMLGAQAPTVSTNGEPLGCRPGEIVSKNWKIYRENRDHFVDVVPAGLVGKPELAVVATADLRHVANGVERKVLAGQWIGRDDILFVINPNAFVMAPRPLDLVAGYGPD